MEPLTLLSSDHPIISSSHLVQEYSQHFLARHNFNFFQYFRYYKEGAISALSNNPAYMLGCLERSFPVRSYYQDDYSNLLSYVVPFDEVAYSLPALAMARERYNLYHIISLVKRHKDYYDRISFAMHVPQSTPFLYYFNHLDQIENFIHQFTQTHSQLLNSTLACKLLLPPFMQDFNGQNICLDNVPKRYPVQGKYQITHITSQELAVLSLLKKGHTYKSVAKELGLSPRTVENYVDNIKHRTGFYERRELLGLSIG